MRFYNWSKTFQETPTCDDVLKRVQRTEKLYWVYMVIAILIGISGLVTIENAHESDIKQIAFGVVVTVFAIVQVALMKIWAHIKLTTYFMIWDRNNVIETELKKSELQDM